ncbi:MAG: DUF1294 domain-containing protein [Verrucomicrobiota bacterium]
MTANRQILSARVAEWDRQKGYGFLDSGRERIFLHRRDFVKWHRPPAVGENIQYSLGRDANGRRCAVKAVQTAGAYPTGRGTWPGTLFFLTLLLIVPGVAGWAYDFNTPAWGAYFLGVNALAWRSYANDKRRAREGLWRVPESTLHFLEVIGGWPAAFLAQRRLRHKSSKSSYQFAFWFIVLLYQLTAWDALHRWKYSRMLWPELEAGWSEESHYSRKIPPKALLGD